MTTFAELYDLTVEQTRRPELVDVTNMAIRTAVLRAHHFDFFPQDMLEGAVVYTPSSNAWQYDISNIGVLLPRYRAIKTVTGLELGTGRPVEHFEWREPDDLYTTEGERRSSVYTLVGTTLRLLPVLASGSATVAYYANPVVTDVGFSSWIADAYPDAVALMAAASVWSRVGFREIAKDTQEGPNKEFKELLISSHLLGEVN